MQRDKISNVDYATYDIEEIIKICFLLSINWEKYQLLYFV